MLTGAVRRVGKGGAGIALADYPAVWATARTRSPKTTRAAGRLPNGAGVSPPELLALGLVPGERVTLHLANLRPAAAGDQLHGDLWRVERLPPEA